MRQLNLKAKTPRRFKLTTDSKHSFPTAPNILDRKFDVDVPNKVWTADISYVWTFEGWLYLAVVMDLYSRQIVGWAMNKRMKKQLVLDALPWLTGKENHRKVFFTIRTVAVNMPHMITRIN
jgi:putative transposase